MTTVSPLKSRKEKKWETEQERQKEVNMENEKNKTTALKYQEYQQFLP